MSNGAPIDETLRFTNSRIPIRLSHRILEVARPLNSCVRKVSTELPSPVEEKKTIRKEPALGAFAVVLLLMPTLSHAQRVLLPPLNLGGTSFLDGVAGPGLLLQERIQYSNVWLFMSQASYLTETKVFGGYYGFEALLPVVISHLPAGDRTGIGDLILSPLQLEWVDHTLFGKRYFQRLNLSFIVPTGQYSPTSTRNIGTNIYSFDPYYAFTLFLTPKLELSARLSYLWNSKNQDPPAAFKSNIIQPGQVFHVNYAMSYAISGKWRAGIAGFYLQQTTPNRVGDRDIAHSKEAVLAIGPGMMYSSNGLSIIFTANFETWEQNRPGEGSSFEYPRSHRFTLSIKKAFGGLHD